MSITTVHRQYFDAFFLFLESNYAPERNMPIHVGTLPPNNIQFIYYNTEQLTHNILDTILIEIKTSQPTEIWDYSRANCDILKSYNIIARHVPLKSPDWYVDKCKVWRNEGIKYDIGFCGGLSERRKAILNEFTRQGLTVACETLWGEERDKILAKCKILVNIHYTENYQIFEAARCELWLSVEVPVVSEYSLDDDPRCINVPYNTIVEKAIEILRKNN